MLRAQYTDLIWGYPLLLFLVIIIYVYTVLSFGVMPFGNEIGIKVLSVGSAGIRILSFSLF